jgi:hypothetical protein
LRQPPHDVHVLALPQTCDYFKVTPGEENKYFQDAMDDVFQFSALFPCFFEHVKHQSLGFEPDMTLGSKNLGRNVAP